MFFGTLFGLFSKESALCAVPLVPFAALMTARWVHRPRPRAWGRAALAALATASAFVLYVEARRRLFPAPLPSDLTVEANAHRGLMGRVFAGLLRWYAQPILPRDPLNNPLVEAPPLLRVAGGLRVYLRGLGQVIFPWTLSGDYSAPQEPIPARVVSVESVLGAAATVLPLVAAPVLGIFAWRRARRADADAGLGIVSPFAAGAFLALAGASLAWVVVSYFPVSNIPVVLPTVRAERFWYFPAFGTSVLVAMGLLGAYRALARRRAAAVAVVLIAAFFGFQGFAARAHANDYTDDLVFWDATRRAVPRSAKAHLNYSVMQGARGRLEERLQASRAALELAPKWPMANVYLGDTLCRLHRADEAWPHYQAGFELAPNDQNLVALAVQCLWDEKKLEPGSRIRDALEVLVQKHPGSWVAFLGRDTIDNGGANNGVDPKYRPRGYNEGPKKE